MICYFTFEDNNGTEHAIPMQVFKTDIAKRWVVAVMSNQQHKDKHIHTAFINQTYKNIFDLQKQLNDLVTDINNVYDIILPTFPNTDILDETTLNDMHRQYEVYGTRVEDGFTPSENLNNKFLLLNELIHTYEELLHNNSDNLPISSMSALVDFYPQTEFYPLLERDKLHLTTQFMWGYVYLGYNTLGKDWLKIAHDNDIDVITRNMIKTQERFSSEAWINFGPDDEDRYTIEAFEHWYLTLPNDLQKLVPIDNLNKLSLGRYAIGRVIIDDGYFLKYHNNKQDWLSYNHPIKRQWNEEVFSTFTKIINIQFSD